MSKVVDIYLNELVPLLDKSLSLSPHNKKCGIELENLSERGGYMQWYHLENNKDKYSIDNGRKSNVMIDGERMIGDLNTLDADSKKNEMIKLFDQGQDVMGRLCDKMRDLIIECPDLYQSKLADKAGFTKDIIDDNRWTFFTIAKVMEEQNMIKKRKVKSRVYFDIADCNISYQPIQYVDKKTHASKLEAELAGYFSSQGYDFEQQITFKDLRHKGQLRIDFLVKVDDMDIYVEVDGKQHYEHVEYFHKTVEEFQLQQERDRIKEEYLKEREMNFIRIRYDEDIVGAFQQKIKTFLK